MILSWFNINHLYVWKIQSFEDDTQQFVFSECNIQNALTYTVNNFFTFFSLEIIKKVYMFYFAKIHR